MFSHIYAAVGDLVRHAVDHGAAGNAFGSRLDSLAKAHEFANHILGCLVKASTFKAPITKLVRKCAEVAVVDGTKVYDSIKKVANQ